MTPVQTITLPNAIYPFRLADLDDFHYGPYRLVNVYRRITDAQRRACVKMWLQTSALSSEEIAWQRSLEVCYLFVHTGDGVLAGVNTAYVQRYPPRDARYFFNRMFIRPAYRDSRLMIVGTTAAICFLRTRHAEEGVRGVVNVNENPKLYRRGMQRMFERAGYRLDGLTDGKETWRFEFDDIRFVDRPAAPAGEP
jgi:hypothetical protein